MKSTDEEFNKWIEGGAYKNNAKVVLLAWIVALIAANPVHVWMLPFFPIGIIGVFPRELKEIVSEIGEGAFGVLGWVGYLFLSVSCVYSPKRTRFYMLLAILIILLVVNVYSCHRVQAGLSKLS